MGQQKESKAHWFVLFGAVLWGTTGTSQALAPAGADSLTIGAVRIAVGGISLIIVSLLRGTLRIDKSWPLFPTIAASICIAVYQPFFFTAVSRTGVAVGTVVTIGSAPVIAGFLSFIIRKEKPEKKWYLATVLAIIGCFLLFFPGDQKINVSGVVLALCAGFSYAFYTLTSKHLLDRHPSEVVIAVIFTISAVLLSPLFFIHKPLWLLEAGGIFVALHLGLFATGLAYLLFSKGLAVIPVATAVTLTLAEPLTAALLGVLFIGERLTATSIIGIALIFAGLVCLSIDNIKEFCFPYVEYVRNKFLRGE